MSERKLSSLPPAMVMPYGNPSVHTLAVENYLRALDDYRRTRDFWLRRCDVRTVSELPEDKRRGLDESARRFRHAARELPLG